MNYDQQSLELHAKYQGKWEMNTKVPLETLEGLSTFYSPGVAAPCREIAEHPEKVNLYTAKKNTIAIISDGSAVLGLGNIGALAGLPVMEGKAILFKKF
jgi:malate dehydrogenase (oxaloacetate-decarboxylating)